MMTPGDGMKNKRKNRLQKLINWVNADENLPPAEEALPDNKDFIANLHWDEYPPDSDRCELAEDNDSATDTASSPTVATAATEIYDGDNECEYPDQVADGDQEAPSEDYVAGDETLSVVPHEAVQLTTRQKMQMKRFRLFSLVLSTIVAVNLIVILLTTVSLLPAFGLADDPTVNEVYDRYVERGLEETGALNIVAAVLFSYRSFDTLGEAFVLFTAVLAVMVLMLKPKDDNVKEGHKNG